MSRKEDSAVLPLSLYQLAFKRASFIRRDRARPHRRELKGCTQDKRSISERSCLAPTLVDRLPGSAQGTTPTASRPPICPHPFSKVRAYGARPCPYDINVYTISLLSLQYLSSFALRECWLAV